MKIQPITVYHTNSIYGKKSIRKTEEPIEQPNFKGLKGILKGVTVGAGATAAGVAAIAGVAALPLFLSYIAVNGAIAGACGHLIENQNKNSDKTK